MSFGQEVKDFISAFKVGSDEGHAATQLQNQQDMMKSQAEYMSARANALNKQTASLNTNVPDPAAAAGAAGRSQYDGQTPKTAPVSLGDNPRAKEAYNYFTSQGWTPAAAAGIVGNLATESSFGDDVIGGQRSGDPSVVNKGLQGQYATGSHFLAQWNGPRLAGLLQLSGGKTPTFQQQLAYVNQELTTGARKSVGAQLQGVTDPSKAAAIAMGFEGPKGYTPGGDPTKVTGWQQRLGYAQDAFAKFGNGNPVATNTMTSTSSATPPQAVADAGTPKTAIPTSAGAGSSPSGNAASTPPAPSIPIVQVNTNPIGMRTAVPVPSPVAQTQQPALNESAALYGIDPNTGQPLDDQQPAAQDDTQQ